MAEKDRFAATGAARIDDYHDGGTKRDDDDSDDVAMAGVGKRQQLKREFTFWTLLGFSASIMCTWEAVLFANFTAMLNGGPPTLIYGFIYTTLGALSTAMSLGEMVSIYPTSGGQYHWTAMLAPKRSRVFLSWFTGWIAVLGWVANAATGSFFSATMIQSILIETDPSYQYHRWHGTLLLWAVMAFLFLVNAAGSRFLSLTEGAVLVLHLSCFLAVMVPLLVLAPKGSGTNVFATFSNEAGWSSNGLAWFVGLTSANLPLIGYDGPAHLVEEVRNATTTVPWCMVLSVVINGITGFGVCIAFSFTILPVIEDALSFPTGLDFVPVFYHAMGNAGGTGLTSLLIILMTLATMAMLATASRQTWALARDQGLPFSHFLAHVNPTLALPLRSIVLCTILPCLIGLIIIGSTVAFNAIVSLVQAGLFTSYFVPITLLLGKKVRGQDVVIYGPWKMPRPLGIAANIFSLVFLLISVFFSFFPPAIPVTTLTMNWSAPVFVGFTVIGLGWYWVWGHRSYNGPIVESTASQSSSDYVA